MIRIFDIVFLLAALIVLHLLLLPIALILRFTGEGEVFYVQERIGSHDAFWFVQIRDDVEE